MVTVESLQKESGISGVDWDIGVFLNGGMTPGVSLEVQVETASS